MIFPSYFNKYFKYNLQKKKVIFMNIKKSIAIIMRLTTILYTCHVIWPCTNKLYFTLIIHYYIQFLNSEC